MFQSFKVFDKPNTFKHRRDTKNVFNLLKSKK